jgi:hypothetical protein
MWTIPIPNLRHGVSYHILDHFVETEDYEDPSLKEGAEAFKRFDKWVAPSRSSLNSQLINTASYHMKKRQLSRSRSPSIPNRLSSTRLFRRSLSIRIPTPRTITQSTNDITRKRIRTISSDPIKGHRYHRSAGHQEIQRWGERWFEHTSGDHCKLCYQWWWKEFQRE